MKTTWESRQHVLAPLRRVELVTPSGYQAGLWKYSDDPLHDVSMRVCGNPTDLEMQTFRKAKSLARKPGAGAWHAAIALLRGHGWKVTDGTDPRDQVAG